MMVTFIIHLMSYNYLKKKLFIVINIHLFAIAINLDKARFFSFDLNKREQNS